MAEKADAREVMAELASRAQRISQEAATRVSSALREVIDSGAGVAGFAVESARDLVQFMVRRGQMTSDEGDALMRQAEAVGARRPRIAPAAPKSATKAAPTKPVPARPPAAKPAAPAKAPPARTPAAKAPPAKGPTPKKAAPAKSTGGKKVAAKAAHPPAKKAAGKGPAKKAAAKKGKR